MANGLCFPTILVAEHDNDVRSPLVRHLQQQGYFVLIAHDANEALEIARVHSRPIHLLLADESLDGRSLAATLKQYRPNMHVLFITWGGPLDPLDTERTDPTLAKVRECVKPPAARAIAESYSFTKASSA